MHGFNFLAAFVLLGMVIWGHARRLRLLSQESGENSAPPGSGSGSGSAVDVTYMSHAHPKIPETWESRSSPYYRSDMDKDSEYYIPKSVRQSWRLLRPSLQDVGVPVPARKNPKESWQNVKKTKFGMPLEFSPQNPPEYTSTKAEGEIE